MIRGEGGFDAEASAMEVDQDGELLVVGLVEFWEVETSRDGGSCEMVMSFDETPVSLSCGDGGT